MVGNDVNRPRMHPKLTQDSLKAVGENLGPSHRLSLADAEKRQLLMPNKQQLVGSHVP